MVLAGLGAGGRVLAVSMANLAPDDTSAAGLLALNSARTVVEGRAAAALITSPPQNLMLADRAGGIAMALTGRTPTRRAGDGALPAPGADGSHDWTGWAPFDALPHAQDPPGGALANANNRVSPPGHPVFLGRDWFGDWRFRRIGEMLAAKVVQDSGGDANAVYVNVSAFAILAAVGDRFKQRYAELCPDCTFDSIDVPLTSLGKDAPDRIVSYLRSHPDVNYVVLAESGSTAPGLTGAMRAAGLADEYPEAGPAWEVSKVYYDCGFNPRKFRTMAAVAEADGEDVPFARRLMMFDAMDAMREVLRRREAGEDVPDPEVIPPWVTADHDVTTQVDVTGFLDERDAALRAHRTQIDPDGMFFDAPHDLQRRAWPWEDFALIDSRVPSELPEHDLFAGLR